MGELLDKANKEPQKTEAEQNPGYPGMEDVPMAEDTQDTNPAPPSELNQDTHEDAGATPISCSQKDTEELEFEMDEPIEAMPESCPAHQDVETQAHHDAKTGPQTPKAGETTKRGGTKLPEPLPKARGGSQDTRPAAQEGRPKGGKGRGKGRGRPKRAASLDPNEHNDDSSDQDEEADVSPEPHQKSNKLNTRRGRESTCVASAVARGQNPSPSTIDLILHEVPTGPTVPTQKNPTQH